MNMQNGLYSSPMSEDRYTIYCGFPGIGKSFLGKLLHSNDYRMPSSDIDSTQFHWLPVDPKATPLVSTSVENPEWPMNYITEVLVYSELVPVFVSSHQVVRDFLVDNRIPFVLVYPQITLKDEYMERFRARENIEVFIDFMDIYWDSLVNSCINQTGCKHIVLQSGQFLSDVVELA